jgi:hypothetical protein
MYHAPDYVWALVLIEVIGAPATASVMLYRSAVAAGVGRPAARGVATGAVVLFGGWITASWLLASAGVYRQSAGHVRPWLGLAFGGFLLTLLLVTRIPVVTRTLHEARAPAGLALPHTLRVVGLLFLIVMAEHHLPAVFALPAGLGDIAIGISAPFVARRLATGAGRMEGVRFNALGLLDLVVALTIGFLAGLGPWRPLNVVPSTIPLSELPLVLVPTMAVPLAIALHLASLTRLRGMARAKRHHAAPLSPRREP